MNCKHNRILKVMVLEDTDATSIGIAYNEVYQCAHCGQTMKVEPVEK